ncbi:MAG TPA: MFS transporter [Methylibium sp.]|nr:MFS transporter [Methylibium sp.]
MNRPGAAPSLATALLPLIGGQLCLHSGMAGLRMAAPLLALRDGHSAFAVGVLLALFAAAPIALALAAGRMADRHGYHRPVRVAVALTLSGGTLAALAAWLLGGWRYGFLCTAAVLSGAGANVGLIAIQRTAGRLARDPTDLKRVFSWLGLAPALSNVAGPVLAGVLIDAAGFATAFAVLALLPLGATLWARRVPVERPAAIPAGDAGSPRRAALQMLADPPMRRLLLVNWLLSTSWDVHSFAVPVLGHERGFSASAIGAILGLFALSVAGVRVVIPALAHRLREAQVLAGAMLLAAAVFGLYPLAGSAWPMAACATVLGLALGAVQPMIMSTLHQITPAHRHGQAIALRSMTINLSSTVMPLGFGLLGASLGAAALFWVMAVAVGVGSWPARRLGR